MKYLNLILYSMVFCLLSYAERKPNVVIILADDLGWHDVSYAGNKYYETPNIDALAASGVKFKNAYAANPLCSPTRASILTGLYPARIGIISAACHKKNVNFEKKAGLSKSNKKVTIQQSVTRLHHKYKTLAETLKENGYATAHMGKWHLGLPPYHPASHGFDIDIPNLPHAPGPPGGYLAKNSKAFPPGKTYKENDHIEEAMASEAEKFIMANKDRPFFLNYWMFSVHGILQARKDYMQYFKKKKVMFDNEKLNPLMGAMIKHMDNGVGRVIGALKKAGVFENTIVIWMSDNGGIERTIKMTPDSEPYGKGLPMTQNAPLKGEKANVYEGGVRVPMAVSYPVAIQKGITSEDIVASYDLYPTILDLADIKSDINFDGISIRPSLEGKKLKRTQYFCHYPNVTNVKYNDSPASILRSGKWKIICWYGEGKNASNRYELFDLITDQGETSNLVSKFPEKFQEMKAKLDKELLNSEAFIPMKKN